MNEFPGTRSGPSQSAIGTETIAPTATAYAASADQQNGPQRRVQGNRSDCFVPPPVGQNSNQAGAAHLKSNCTSLFKLEAR